MQLSWRDITFLIEAVRFRIEWHEERLKEEGGDDDMASDLGNDMHYLQALKKTLEQEAERLIKDPNKM